MEDLNVATIDRIISLAQARVVEVGDYLYIDKDNKVTRFQPPIPHALELTKLGGFIDLLEHSFEAYPVGGVLVHVVSHEQVELISTVSDKYGRRRVYCKAVAQKPERVFQFNKYIPQEQFVIALRSLFIQDSDLDNLVQAAGNLAAKSEMRQLDDGFTQRVTQKAGVVMVKEVTILPRVALAPFRTFREAVQPKSEYVFRVKGDESGNECALFEADGGSWKLEAIENVKTWLSNQLKGSTVEGLADLPIIA